jgi:hypothetical protein
MLKTIHNKFFYIGLIAILILVLAFFVLPNLLPANFANNPDMKLASVVSTSSTTATTTEPEILKKAITHIKTPEPMKAIYMTACVAGTPSFRAKLLKLAKETEINAIVIDVKDYTGTVSFDTDHPSFINNSGTGCRVKDMRDFIEILHQNNIYVIARITAFQDPYITKIHPEWAVKKNSDRSVVWKDRKGISFVDVGNKEMWQYLVDLGKESYAIGFDEINYDYIRYPSDGNMKDIYFPWSEEIWAQDWPPALTDSATSTASTTIRLPKVSPKSLVLREFFEFLKKSFAGTGIVISADIFGMTTTNYDDLNIGQILEDAARNFDYVAPMVYPSHYPVGFMGYKSTAEVNANGYNIVNYSMKTAVDRLTAIGESPLKLRPWLQDNDYPVHYTPAMVREQIQATYDAGLTSWFLWDAGNTYTEAALLTQ